MTNTKDVLKAISPEEALAVLNQLTKDPAVRRKAEEIAVAILSDVDVESVADEVQYQLESIPVEDVWDHSGATRNGYIEPGEYAWQLFEEALEPFEVQLRRYQDFSLITQAKLQCMGILKGIHDFESESKTEFKEWAVDAPGENMARVFEVWKKGSTSRTDIAEVKRFMDSLNS
jgi:hypothetical protein